MPKAVRYGLSIVAGLAVLALACVGALFSRNPLETFVFYVFAGTMMGSSLAVVLTRNIVHSAVWLLGTLGSAACLFFLLAANLLAAVQLIVYAGGILILIVFGVMLTARNPYMRTQPKRGEIVMASVASLVLFSGLVSVAMAGPWPDLPGQVAATQPARVAAVREIGNALLTDYLVPFEATSVLLLAAMIGAAYLARPEKR